MTRGSATAAGVEDQGRTVREARLGARLTQADLARSTGISIGAIRDLEQGRTRSPGPTVSAALRDLLGVDLAEAKPPDASAEPRVRLNVLGPLHCSIDGRDVTPTGRLQATMVTVAAVHVDELVSDDVFVDLMWPRDRPRDVSAALHTHAARLRSVLGSGAHSNVAVRNGADSNGRSGSAPSLLRERRGYRLVTPAGSVDVSTFADLLQRASRAGDRGGRVRLLLDALALWRGPVAADVPELALHPRVAAWERRRRDAAVDLARHALAGEPATAAAAAASAKVVLDDHPLDEQLATAVVRLLVDLGRPADALTVFGRIRSALADELGAEPGPALRKAYGAALQPTPPRPPARTEPVRGGWSPAELPRDIADFVGRDDEIATARAELLRTDGLPGLVAIVGMGGVGKSTLATRIAHEIRGEFPDGQLHLDLRATDERPVSTSRAVDLLLRRLDVTSDPADEPADRAALLRTALSRGRHLLVLDNVSGAAQIRDLLPGSSGSAAVVISRRSLVGLDGVRRIRLGTLPPPDARAFVRRLVGAGADDESAVAGIAEACGYLPLALRLAADHAVTVHADLAALQASLADANTRWRVLRQGDRAVRASLELGWSALDPRLRRTLGDLASLPGGEVHCDAALAAAGVMDDEGLVALGELSLLELRAGRRVGMHDLVRAVVRELEPRDPAQADGPVGRAVAWYSRQACSWTAARYPYRPQPSGTAGPAVPDGASTVTDAVRWLDEEHVALLGLTDAMLTGRAPFDWRLVFAVALSCEDKEESARAIGMTRDALPLVEDDDEEGRAFLELVLARAYGMSSHYTEARAHLVRLRDRQHEPGMAGLAVWAHELTGLVLDSSGDQDLAAHHYGLALELARQAGLPEAAWSVLHNLADLEMGRGRVDVAQELLERESAANVGLGNHRSRQLTLANLGTAAWLAGDDARAIDLLAPLTEGLVEMHEVRAAGEALLVQAHAAVALDRRDLADPAAARALDLAVRLDDGQVFARVLAAVAVVEARWYDLDRGTDGLAHALAITRALGASSTTLEILLAHGVSTLIAARPDLVRSAAREAQQLADAVGSEVAAQRALRLLTAVGPAPVPRP